MSVQELLYYVKGEGGADLFLTSGVEPRMRRYGVVHPIPNRPALTARNVSELMRGVCKPDEWDEFERTNDIDFAFSVRGIGRVRANYLQQTRGPSAVFRLIPDEILPFNHLGVPAPVARFASMQSGLVLVTGPVGSGKTTTLAAVIDIINRKSARHIVTIEDPIEFIHKNRNSMVTQREVGTSCEDFAPALRNALRQDANVILVGELRDYDTAVTTLVAAAMGKLVFASMHTNSAEKSVNRLINMFPVEEQDFARVTLGNTLVGVVSQILLPAVDESSAVVIVEILMRTPTLGPVIREGNIAMITSIIQAGAQQGMQLMDDAIIEALRQERISVKDAFGYVVDKERFERLFAKAMHGAWSA